MKIKIKKIIWTDDDDDDDDNFSESNDQIQIDMNIIRQLFQEYEILSFINHPNIVKVYGLYRGNLKYSPAILLEYCKHNLEQIINSVDDINLVSIMC